ncbi:MAG: hypothetical protein IJS97_00665 [Prevotella sp.]|nr:hypothetical protein [Prevotella sp.]
MIRYIIMGAVLLFLAACSTDEQGQDNHGNKEGVQEERLVELNMTVCFQPDIDMTEDGTRTPGDPGTYEHFGYPRYFYIYAVGFTEPEGAYPEASGGRVCPMVVDDEDVNRIDIGDDPEDWQTYLMTVDPPQTLNDSIYGSKQRVSFKIPESITKLRFYVAASATELTHNGHKLGIKVGEDNQVLGISHHESDVLALMFDVDDNLKTHLQDLYSSPYNYCPSAAPYNGLYYYTITDLKNAGDITRIIYHVASKVDVKWNVDPTQQQNFYISRVEAKKLKKLNCLLFRPTENLWTSADEDDGDSENGTENYSHFLINNDIGQQWYGRQYFYTIPFQYDENSDGILNKAVDSYFDVNLLIRKTGVNTHDGEEQNLNYRHRRNLSSSRFNIFVPWVRADLDFTADMVPDP